MLIETAEHRVLSKTTNAAGGFTVPADFDSMIVSARRSRGVVGVLARELVTDSGVQLPVPAATAHGSAAWTAENASYTASDDTFAQTVLGAFKASTKTIVSEELAQDAAADFDQYLADELGQRTATLEETAFAVGDGTGKPLGSRTRRRESQP